MKKITVSFLEKRDIIENIDKFASERGTDRSAVIRECIRKELSRIGELKGVVKNTSK